jgi:putative phosphoesterase
MLREEALRFLEGADHIVHGGDIGGPQILASLAELAPVTAVRGNNDTGPWAEGLAEVAVVRLAGLAVGIVHALPPLKARPGLADRALERALGAVRIIIHGHSHQPRIAERGAVLAVNPGSAGPRRFQLPIAAGELLIEGDALRVRLVDLARRPVGSCVTHEMVATTP